MRADRTVNSHMRPQTRSALSCLLCFAEQAVQGTAHYIFFAYFVKWPGGVLMLDQRVIGKYLEPCTDRKLAYR